MSAPVPYFDVVRQMKNAFNYRLQLVTYARRLPTMGGGQAARICAGKDEMKDSELGIRGLAAACEPSFGTLLHQESNRSLPENLQRAIGTPRVFAFR
jgi:hypothetical protein